MRDIKIRNKIYDGHACVVFAILLALIYFEIRGGRSYFDEILCLFAIVYLTLLAIQNKLAKNDSINILLIVCVIGIGLLSNLLSGISVPIFSVIVDIIAETKVLWIFFAVKYFVNSETKKSLVRMLTPVTKIYIILAFVFSVLSQFVNIGMTGSERYGIKEFKFFFPMSFQFLAVSLIALAVLSLNSFVRYKTLYYIMACISLMLATKSSPLLFGIMFLFFLSHFKRKSEIKVRTIVILAVVIIIIGGFQIQTYLMNENAPRYLFFYYGSVTANDYFPLGSGFATFGSDQAARQYSPLYYDYGFNNLFGMNPEDGSFLSDTFWAMAIGQFGWIGFALYCSVYVHIFISFKKNHNMKADQKALLYSGYISYIIHAVGSAILSSSAGVIGFIALAMVLDSNNSYGDNCFLK